MSWMFRNYVNICMENLPKDALQINENDVTLDYEYTILLSHESTHKYDSAYELGPNKLIGINKATKCYNILPEIISNHLDFASSHNDKKQNSSVTSSPKNSPAITGLNPTTILTPLANTSNSTAEPTFLPTASPTEIQLQRAILVEKQVVNILETNESNKHCSMTSILINKSITNCGGLFLVMFQDHVEVEAKLLCDMDYDFQCISIHYYLGQYLYAFEHNNNEGTIYLNEHIAMELPNKNICNKTIKC